MRRDASDRKQTDLSTRQQDRRGAQLESDLRDVLRIPGGRRWFQFLLDKLQPRTPMWQPNATVQFLAAQYDAGSWIKNEIDKADPDALARMMAEKIAQDKVERSEREALATKRASQKAASEQPAGGDDDGN